MGTIITIAGQRGGTGKSVTAVNLAVSMALYEKKVLMIDCDPKGCSTRLAGMADMDLGCDITAVLSAKARLKDAIYKTEFNFLDMIPSGLNLFQAALKVSRTPGNEKVLGLLIKDVKDSYDYIILDTPSSYDFLTLSALTAADHVLVCMTPECSTAEDMNELLRVVRYLKTLNNVTVKISGILFLRTGSREQIESFLLDQGLEQIRSLVLETHIPADPSLQQSVALNMPVVLHNAKCGSAQAYLAAARNIHSILTREVDNETDQS